MKKIPPYFPSLTWHLLVLLIIFSIGVAAFLINRPKQEASQTCQEMKSPLVNTPTPYPSPTATLTPTPAEFNIGYASYYGERFRGQITASGEVFNPDDLTCAHRTLSFDTVIKLWYDGNEAVCRVNDRGPYIAGRVLDLSRATFMSLADLNKGVIKVKWQVVQYQVRLGQ